MPEVIATGLRRLHKAVLQRDHQCACMADTTCKSFKGAALLSARQARRLHLIHRRQAPAGWNRVVTPAAVAHDDASALRRELCDGLIGRRSVQPRATEQGSLPYTVRELLHAGSAVSQVEFDWLCTSLLEDMSALSLDDVCETVFHLSTMDCRLHREILDQLLVHTHPRLTSEPCRQLHLLLVALTKLEYQPAADWLRRVLLRLLFYVPTLDVTHVLELGTVVPDLHLRCEVGCWHVDSKRGAVAAAENTQLLHAFFDTLLSCAGKHLKDLEVLQFVGVLKVRLPWDYQVPVAWWNQVLHVSNLWVDRLSRAEQVWVLSRLAAMVNKSSWLQSWTQGAMLTSSRLWEHVHEQLDECAADELHELLVGVYYELSQTPPVEVLRQFYWKSTPSLRPASSDWLGWTAKIVQEYSSVYVDTVWLEEFLHVVCLRAGHLARGLEVEHEEGTQAVEGEMYMDACAYQLVRDMCTHLRSTWDGWAPAGLDRYLIWLQEFSR